jgi:hypothetical protein
MNSEMSRKPEPQRALRGLLGFDPVTNEPRASVRRYPETLVLYRPRPVRLSKSTCNFLRGASDTAV